MKRLIALTAAVILLIAGCSSQKAYTFYGTVSATGGSSIVIDVDKDKSEGVYASCDKISLSTGQSFNKGDRVKVTTDSDFILTTYPAMLAGAYTVEKAES